LTVPAVALCVLAGYGVMGFTTLGPGPARERWRRAAVAALVVGVAFLVVKASSFERLRDELRFIERTHTELSGLLEEPRVRAAMRCGELTFPTYRLVPDARWILDDRSLRVRSRAHNPSQGAVAVYITGDEKFERRFGRADGVDRATNRLQRGSSSLRRGPFAVYIDCTRNAIRPPG
ncbi:MAG: hypothetical protein ACRDKY_12255, partial [Solirubrobacteraceae bacterium]